MVLHIVTAEFNYGTHWIQGRGWLGPGVVGVEFLDDVKIGVRIGVRAGTGVRGG